MVPRKDIYIPGIQFWKHHYQLFPPALPQTILHFRMDENSQGMKESRLRCQGCWVSWIKSHQSLDSPFSTPFFETEAQNRKIDTLHPYRAQGQYQRWARAVGAVMSFAQQCLDGFDDGLQASTKRGRGGQKGQIGQAITISVRHWSPMKYKFSVGRWVACILNHSAIPHQ